MPALPLRFEWLASFATLWTLAIEVLIAISFLQPDRRRLTALRDPALLMFCATTYALLPTIAAFGWLLLAMGVAQCEAERHRMRLAYLGVFALLLVYREVDILAVLP
jgi:amino acid permease